MFYYIEGTVAAMETGVAVIDAGGVGFMCFVSMNTLSKLEMGKKARLYISESVREDAFDLFGFYEQSEKKCFEQLTAVSGVGPKAAMSILSSATAEEVALAVVTENEKLLTSAPGVGKRLAQRIILELKDKITKDDAGKLAAPVSIPTPASGGTKKLADVTAALTVLGYTGQEINVALRGIDIESLPVEEIVRTVLKNS